MVIQYNTQDEEVIAQLEAFARSQEGFPCHLLVAPYPDMPFTIAVTAWGARDVMADVDEARLQEFFDFYQGVGLKPVPCSPPTETQALLGWQRRLLV